MRKIIAVVALMLWISPSFVGLAEVFAQGQQLREPLTNIVVTQERGEVSFSFFIQSHPSGGLVPGRAVRLTVVRDEGAVGPLGAPVVWRIEYKDYTRATPNEGAQVLSYGEVPDDWIQQVPRAGFAPPLESNVVYRVEADIAGAIGSVPFRYWGR